MIDATEALERLTSGNSRFVAGDRNEERFTERRLQLTEGQEPFAVILGCADSRVPVEIVFDQGPGDLFVIRVAGNVVAPSQVDSVEFAVDKLHTRLVVVLGHTGCGAINATLDYLRGGAGSEPSFGSIVERVRPAVEELLATDLDKKSLADHAVRANVRMSADHLRHGSRILEDRVVKGDLLVVGAVYSLETGRVEFFDGVPGS